MGNRRSLNLLITGIVLWGFILGTMVGCVAAEKKPMAVSSSTGDRVQEATLLDDHGEYPHEMEMGDIFDNVEDFRDRVVIVKGRFMGWQGNCTYLPPATRSDWMLHQHGRCIYVTGKTAVNLDRQRNSPDIGRRVKVRGIILVDPKGNPYIKASSVEVEAE